MKKSCCECFKLKFLHIAPFIPNKHQPGAGLIPLCVSFKATPPTEKEKSNNILGINTIIFMFSMFKIYQTIISVLHPWKSLKLFLI